MNKNKTKYPLAFVTVMIRRANKFVHDALSPFYFGILTYIEVMLLLVFIPSVYNFEHYTFFGVAMFLLSGIFNYTGQTLKSASLKFEDASVVSPFSYFQVVYLFIADILIFSYSFSSTDIIGVSIISVWLLGPEVYTMISYFKAKKQAL